MNQRTLNKLRNYDPACSDLMRMAEQELAACFRAVTELFGSEQAEVSAKEWLHELMASHPLPDSSRQWRDITIKVLARLASRVHPASLSTSTASPTFAYSD
jgi:hypothetical protein